MKKYFIVLMMLLSMSVTCAAQWTLEATPKRVTKLGAKGTIIEDVENLELKVRFIPAMPGQSTMMVFALHRKGSNTAPAVSFFPIPQTSYFYDYKDTNGQVLDRVLYLFARGSDNVVSLWVSQNYRGTGSVLFNVIDSKSKDVLSGYEAVLYEADASRIFLKVARTIRDLGVPKSRDTSLYIDVDF